MTGHKKITLLPLSLVILTLLNCSYTNAGTPEALDGKTREGYIQVAGGKVWYKITGADKKGVPLLVLHGGPGAPHDYLEPLEALADERPVIFYDQLGCGNSDKPSDKSLWTMERFVEELATVRKDLNLEKVHILGQSWGSMLAVDYMLEKKPEGVASLVLSGPCLSTPRFVADQRKYLEQMPKEDRKIITECEKSGNYDSPEYQDAMIKYYKIHVCRLDPWPDCFNRTIEKLSHEVYEYMWGPSEFTMTGTLKNYDRTERLKEIKAPALFICGRYDEATPETTAWYHEKMPGSELVIIEDSSHGSHLEKERQYLETVRDFLRRAEKKKNGDLLSPNLK